MIDEAPRITISPVANRPDPALIDPFRGLQTGFVVDAMGGSGALDYRIKPVDPAQSALCGIALTCHAGPADNLAVLAALEHLQPGDVIVAATGPHEGCAVVGDLVLGMAKNGGAQGFVTDGLVRDTRGIRAVGLPCFTVGVSPNSPAKSGPGTLGLPIVIGGVVVTSGDLIVADEDGVVVVPQALLESTAERLKQVLKAESDLDAKVKSGMTDFDLTRSGSA